MKFIVDQQLPPLLCDWLVAKGHHADHTLGMYLGKASDEAIADRAKRTGAIIVTRDKDYVRIVDRDQVLQLVWVRTGNCTNPQLIAAFERCWPDAEVRLARGQGLIEIA